MEEIGYRSVHFVLDAAIEDRPAYVTWLIGACKAKDAAVVSMIDDAAIALLAVRLRTPLQIEQHLTLAFETRLPLRREAGHRGSAGNRPLTTTR
jgi:hypothetical protein